MDIEAPPTLLFLYGPIASGKLTVARRLADRTGWALFHNHLVVDAVAALFPFGSPDFIRLRERFWMEAMVTAVRSGRSIIFTFAPEPSVAPDFPHRLTIEAEAAGGSVRFVALTASAQAQEERVANADRAAFGKLRSLDLLRAIRADCDRCLSAMPTPEITIDTLRMTPEQAAETIFAQL